MSRHIVTIRCSHPSCMLSLGHAREHVTAYGDVCRCAECSPIQIVRVERLPRARTFRPQHPHRGGTRLTLKVLLAGGPDETLYRYMRDDPCAYCGGLGTSWDHITPRSRGGENRDNIARACGKCNSEKSSSSLLHFLANRNFRGRRKMRWWENRRRKWRQPNESAKF